MLHRFAIALLLSCAGWPLAAGASAYDACILDNMRGTTSDAAARAIKESCIRRHEKTVPAELVTATFRNATIRFDRLPAGEGGQGIYVTVNNNSGYTFSELTFRIEDRKNQGYEDYIVRPFVAPPTATTPGSRELLGPGLGSFYFRIRQDAPGTWLVSQAKGFRN